MTTKKERKEQELEKIRENLRELVKPGDTVYTSLRHVSRSGMYRVIDLFVMKDNRPLRISWEAAQLLEGYDSRHDGCKASGCGMDMGFALVYNLGWELFRKGWECVGEHCPNNSHVNDRNAPRGKGVMHTEAGYSLRHKWL